MGQIPENIMVCYCQQRWMFFWDSRLLLRYTVLLEAPMWEILVFVTVANTLFTTMTSPKITEFMWQLLLGALLIVESKCTNNSWLECLELSHGLSRSLRGQKAGLWTKRYVLFVEKGNIDERRSEKSYWCMIEGSYAGLDIEEHPCRNRYQDLIYFRWK